MPRYDLYHDAVRQALRKDDWIITDDPLTLEYEDLQLFADLGAEKTIAAEKQGRKIAVEIKSFVGPSPVNELQKAIGQYAMYRTLLEHGDPERVLFLAVPTDAYDGFLQRQAVRLIVKESRMNLLVYDPDAEVIREWIS